MNNKTKNNFFTKNKKYLPNAKILILAMALLVIFILMIIFKDKILPTENVNSKDLSSITLRAIKGIGNNEKDTDGDGISDFEEELNGTNINKKDTDGDGLSDYLEKKLGTDPKIKREFDPIVKKKIKEFKKNKTASDRTVNDFLEQILIASRRKITAEEGEKIAKNIYLKNTPRLSVIPKYNLSNIKYADQITLRQYKNSFIAAGTILNTKELDIDALLARYISFPEPVARKLLNNSIKVLKKYKDQVLKMQVPTVAKNDHLKYINSLSLYINTVQGIVDNFPEDPITAMAYLQRKDATFEIFYKNKEFLNKLYFR